MRRIATVAAVWSLLAVATNAQVYTFTFRALIDGRDQLMITPGRLQWHHLDWAAVGRHEGRNEPTIISSTSNGTPVLSNFEWTPSWPNPVPDEIRFEAFSSVFTGLAPVLPGEPWTVSLEVIAARSILQVVEFPSEANGFSTVVEFDDNYDGGSDWYEARLTFTPIPEPGAGAMLMVGLGLFHLFRRMPRGAGIGCGVSA